MKSFLRDLLTDSKGDYSSRLISGWITFFVWLVMVVVSVLLDKNVSDVSTPLLIYIGSCFGLSVIGEITNKDKKTYTEEITLNDVGEITKEIIEKSTEK